MNSKLLGPRDVIKFKGEEQIVGNLVNESVVDLGIIFRRDLVVASMEFFEIENYQEIELRHDLSYFFCVQGSMAVAGQIVESGNCL